MIGQAGAEKLSPRGDMFVRLPLKPVIRIQGAFISDEEIDRLTNFWKKDTPHTKSNDEIIQDEITPNVDQIRAVEDTLLDDVIQFLRERKVASTSSVQRKFRIGYTRAARIIDTLEARGIVGPPKLGSKLREVISVDDNTTQNSSLPQEYWDFEI